MSKTEKRLAVAMELLGEIESQDFIKELLWESKELRRWRKKTLKLLHDCGYVDTTKESQ